jgi:hypothetical protein
MTNSLSADIQTFLQKDSTKTFLKVAEQFIALIEADNISKEDFFRQAHTTLIDLYAAGHKLEIIELKYSSADSDFGKTDDEFFKNKNQAIISTLGEDAFYWEVFDPTYFEKDGNPGQGWQITDKEPTQGWLVDDFADIYRDLKIEIEKMKIGTDEAIEDALWQMKFSSRNHWGQHCINAIRALHFLWYDGKNTL